MRKRNDVVETEPNLALEAYRQLRDLIVVGKLSPGMPLVESELATRFGISRTPVRAAVQRLQQERFVAVTKAGTLSRSVVTSLTADDMRELFAIVGALEGIAGELAAQLPDDTRVPLVERMRRINRSLRSATQKKPADLTQAQDLHVQFHRSYVAATAGPRLRAELDAIQPHSERYERAYTTALIGDFNASLAEHEAIIEAIAARDPAAAARQIAQNWRAGAQRYGRVVALLGERGVW